MLVGRGSVSRWKEQNRGRKGEREKGFVHSIKSTRYRSSASSSPRRLGSCSRGRPGCSGMLGGVVFEFIEKRESLLPQVKTSLAAPING